jgi:hypothetical protein
MIAKHIGVTPQPSSPKNSLRDVLVEYRAERPGGAFQKNRFEEDRRLPTTKISLRTARPIGHCCSNPRCRDGGYDVTALAKEMLLRGEKEWEGWVHCTSREWEGDKPWEECRRCEWAWDIRITLISKEEKGHEWYQ